jgi:hypothetical protein
MWGDAERFARKSLASQQDLAGADQVSIVVEQRGHDFAFTDLGIGRTPHDGHAITGADQVELQTPVPPRVGRNASPSPGDTPHGAGTAPVIHKSLNAVVRPPPRMIFTASTIREVLRP